MPSVRANGIETYYEDAGGEGEPVVLVHGHSVDLRMWPSQFLALREAGYRPIRYDVRGHGRTTAPDGGYFWQMYAADLRALLDALDIATAHLVGFSMGGGIAIEFALDNPGRVRSLTLVAAALPGYAYSEEFAARVEALVEAVRAEGWPRAAERLWLPNPMFDGLRRHPAAFQVVRDLVMQFPARDYLVESPEPEGPEAIERLAELRPPVLVIVGEEDLEDFRLAAQVIDANAPRVRLEVVPGAGHMLPLERPEELNRLLIDFLRDPQAASPPPAPILEVRGATPDDLEAIAGLDARFATRRALRLERRGRAPEQTIEFSAVERAGEPWRADVHAPDWWGEHLRDGDRVLVATVGGAVMGAITLQEWEHTRTEWVVDIRVDVQARLHGLGRALMDAAAARARERGLLSLRLETQSDNLDGVGFLLRYGFRFSGFDDRLYLHRRPIPGLEDPVALFFTYELTRA